ncbi:MAG: hypothetical protein ACTSWW_09550 [Promethearchaeota archaeon]
MNEKKPDMVETPRKILDHLIPGEKVLKSFFIPIHTTSLFGFIIWSVLMLLPIFLMVYSHNSAEITENTQEIIDTFMIGWFLLTISLLIILGYGERHLIITNKRVIYHREYNLLFLKKIKMIREYTAKIGEVKSVERRQYRYPDIQIMIIGIFTLLAGVILWVFKEITDATNSLTEQEIYWLNFASLLTMTIAGIILILNFFFFSSKYFKIILVIGQTFPLPAMFSRIFSLNVKSGYWVIGGGRKDAKKMYQQAHNVIFELQEHPSA